MNTARCTNETSIDFLVASQGRVSCSEAARVPPESPVAPDHDAFTRLLHRLEPDPEALWEEAEPLVVKHQGVLVLDDATLDHLSARHTPLVTHHWSGTHRETVRGINLISLGGWHALAQRKHGFDRLREHAHAVREHATRPTGPY